MLVEFKLLDQVWLTPDSSLSIVADLASHSQRSYYNRIVSPVQDTCR